MVEYHKAPKLEKPTALRNYLLDKRYTILTTTIPVGDIVEYGLDWVVGMLTTFNDGVANAFTELQRYLDDNYITLDDYYSLKFQHDLEIVARGYMTWGDYFADKFEHDKWIIQQINDKVSLVAADLTAIDEKYKVWVERLVELIADVETSGISINLSLVNLGGRLSAVEAEFGGRKNLFQWTWDFFTDPVKWLYETVDELITRFF